MLSFLRGYLHLITPIAVILDVSGVGYKVFVPPTLFNDLPEKGKEVLLHVSFVIRENMQSLYGFMSVQERDLFDVLISVSGVGPKIGLAIVGHLPLELFKQAIQDGDLTSLCRVPGIGKKTAQRLLLEVKDKIPAFFANISLEDTSPSSQLLSSPKIQDALGALIHLGYQQSVAQKALKKAVEELGEDVELGTLITKSLQYA